VLARKAQAEGLVASALALDDAAAGASTVQVHGGDTVVAVAEQENRIRRSREHARSRSFRGRGWLGRNNGTVVSERAGEDRRHPDRDDHYRRRHGENWA
jgi:hypothetical protein